MAEELVVCVPTHDKRVILVTILELLQAGAVLGRSVRFLVGEASNIPRSRNYILAQLRSVFPDEDSHKVLWVDSDIIVPPKGHVAISRVLARADELGVNVVANYLMANGQPVLMKSRSTRDAFHYSEAELAALDDFSEVAMSGLGFTYVQQPLKYTFHADAYGEDVNMWLDHPHIRLSYAKEVMLGHRKATALWPETALPPSSQLV